MLKNLLGILSLSSLLKAGILAVVSTAFVQSSVVLAPTIEGRKFQVVIEKIDARQGIDKSKISALDALGIAADIYAMLGKSPVPLAVSLPPLRPTVQGVALQITVRRVS